MLLSCRLNLATPNTFTATLPRDGGGYKKYDFSTYGIYIDIVIIQIKRDGTMGEETDRGKELFADTQFIIQIGDDAYIFMSHRNHYKWEIKQVCG